MSETTKVYCGVDSLRLVLERLDALEARAPVITCGTCGRETLPDGDCYGCEADRLLVALDEAEKHGMELQAWKEGAKGAAIIANHPREGGHTEEIYLTHRDRYMESAAKDGPYAAGADCVAAAITVSRRGGE